MESCAIVSTKTKSLKQYKRRDGIDSQKLIVRFGSSRLDLRVRIRFWRLRVGRAELKFLRRKLLKWYRPDVNFTRHGGNNTRNQNYQHKARKVLIERKISWFAVFFVCLNVCVDSVHLNVGTNKRWFVSRDVYDKLQVFTASRRWTCMRVRMYAYQTLIMNATSVSVNVWIFQSTALLYSWLRIRVNSKMTNGEWNQPNSTGIVG